MVCVGPRLFYYYIWSNPFSLQLVSALGAGVSQSTRLPTTSSHNLTFEYLHALVSSWYFYKFATAFSLCDSSRSFSLASFGHTVSYPVFMPKPSTHRMHDPESIVPHIRLNVLIDNQMSRV
jgi:hypothetical protein